MGFRVLGFGVKGLGFRGVKDDDHDLHHHHQKPFRLL